MGPSEANESRWQVVSDLLADASELSAKEWRGFLQSRTENLEIVEEVLSLLQVPVPENGLSMQGLPEWVGEEGDAPATEPRLQAGETIDGRFRIEAFVGRGGMGEVYSAVDQELNVRVAVKILHPELSGEPSYVSRFKREIGLAREITHPNVARVFDLGRKLDHSTGPLYYFAMELLIGETLAARLRRGGPMDMTEALAVARQLGEGLRAAHEARVVHRDFKPSNVILVGKRAVITDFGLAVPETADGAEGRSTTSLRLGTPGYVAPEQWAGKRVTAANDIYALGIVLHEMVTGRHPNDPGSPKPDAPWCSVIAKCLELEPRNRWGSAAEAIAALEPGWVSRRRVMWAVGGTVGVSGLGYGAWRLWPTGAMERVVRLLVAPIHNLTGDARFDGATAMLQAQLDQSPQLQLVTAEQREQGIERMGLSFGARLDAAKLRELAWRLRTPAVLHGTLALVGGDYLMSYVLETLRGRPDAVGGKAEKTFRAMGPDDLVRQFRAAGAWVRESAGESLAQIAENDRPPQEVSTGSWEALAAYSRAVWATRHGNAEETAEQYLKEALAADPGFVAAQQELADLYISKARFAEGHAQWEKAIDLLSHRRVTFRERYRLESLYFEDSFQYGKQLEAVRAWAIHYPEDEQAHYFLGSSLFHHHRFDESLRSFESAWKIQKLPRTAGYAVAVGWMKRDTGLSDEWLEALRTLGSDAVYLKWVGQTAFLRGEYEKAQEAFRGVGEKGELGLRDQGMAYLTCLYAEAGRLDVALAHCRRHVAEARKWGRPAVLARRLLHLAYLLLVTGDRVSSVVAAKEAAEGERAPQPSKELASYYRLAGDGAGLTRLAGLASSWPVLPVFTGSKEWIAAEQTCLARGPKAAEALYSHALQVTSPYMWPAVAIGTGLQLRSLPEHVPLMPAMWYLAQRYWPGMLRSSGAAQGALGMLDDFGGTLT